MKNSSRGIGYGLRALLAATVLAGAGAAVFYLPLGVEMPGWARSGSTGGLVTGATAGQLQFAQAAQKGSRDANGTAGTTTTTRTFGGWTVSCSEGGNAPARICSANFRVINKQNNSNVLVWIIGYDSQGQLLTEILTLSDVRIQPGVTVEAEGIEPARAEFVECTPRGCKARLEMTSELSSRLKSAEKATIAMTRIDGQVIRFEMEIPGIDQAMEELGV